MIVEYLLSESQAKAHGPFLSTFHVHLFPQILELLCGRTRAYMVMLSTCSDLPKNNLKNQIMPLHNLPYDLLLNISQYLDLHDIYALQLVSLIFVLHVEQS